MSHKKQILVVEDSQDFQSLISLLFKEKNFELVQAYDGQQALFLAQTMQPTPSIILLDMQMPVMNGVEFLQEKLNDPKISDVPVVVITSESDIKPRVALLCANEFVQKPMRDPGQLVKIVQRIVHEN